MGTRKRAERYDEPPSKELGQKGKGDGDQKHVEPAFEEMFGGRESGGRDLDGVLVPSEKGGLFGSWERERVG